MILEIEVKGYADNLIKIEKELQNMGGMFLKEEAHRDEYFDTKERNLINKDKALRIRTIDGEQFFLTYKGPKIDTKTKTREEIEISVSNSVDTGSILKRMGFERIAVIEKIRKKYELAGYKICLDNVKDMGKFIEVETTGEKIKELRDQILGIIKKLGIEKTERKSYLELFLDRYQ